MFLAFTYQASNTQKSKSMTYESHIHVDTFPKTKSKPFEIDQ